MNVDVVVVGAGPAGSTVAGIVASSGLDVLVLEKGRSVGESSCAGYVSSIDFPDIDERVIQSKIENIRTYFPSGGYVDFPVNGFNVNRTLFDMELALNAARCGAKFRVNSGVVGLIEEGNGYSGVLERTGREIKAKIIVGADGVSSITSRCLGFRNDVAVSVQYEIFNCGIESGTNEIYFDYRYSPGGYIWIFPTGTGTARVGLAVRTHLANKPVMRYMSNFLEKHLIASGRFKNMSWVKMAMGTIPVGGLHKRIQRCNLLLVGDAAGMADPVTGAGISYAMTAGRIAAGAILRAIEKDDLSFLRGYEQGFKRIMFKHYEKSLEKRKIMDSIKDNKSLEKNLPDLWVIPGNH